MVSVRLVDCPQVGERDSNILRDMRMWTRRHIPERSAGTRTFGLFDSLLLVHPMSRLRALEWLVRYEQVVTQSS